MMTFDMVYTCVLLGIGALVVVAYFVRLGLKGRAQYNRVDKDGGSALLGKGIMEMGYWAMQPVAKFLIFLHITPNMLSWSSLVFGSLAGICLAYGHFGFGAAFAMVSALLDSLDGTVARYTGAASDAGEVLDAAIDRYVEFVFLAGLIVYYREIPPLQCLALLALLGSFMVSYSTAKAEALHIEPPRGSMRRPERAFYLTLGAALSPVTIPWFEAYREFSVPVGHPMVIALCLVAVMANVSAVERLHAIYKSIRARDEKKRVEARAAAAALAREEAHQNSEPHPVKIR